jgi:UDP-N-acetylglucosamine diphosphorylase/glucosamine-1-phosphate N-acetyltransferase
MDNTTGRRPLAVVIMAAGKGTRMNNPAMAKVMFPVGDVPMIHHVVQLALDCRAERIIAIIGYNRESVRAYLDEAFAGRVEYAEQVEQLGTGHAVIQTVPLLSGFDGDVLVLSGDVPLLGRGTIDALAALHREEDATATVLTVRAPDPTGYGRVIRNQDRSVARIVEQRDAGPEELAVDEVNSGIYMFRVPDLLEALRHLRNDNAQGEYYLTDVFGWFASQGKTIAAYTSSDFTEVQGINTVANLEEVNTEFARREMGKSRDV